MTDRWFSHLLYKSTVHLYLVYSFVSCLETDMRELGKVQRRTVWMLEGGMEWLPLMEELSISGQEKRCLNKSLTNMTWRFLFFTQEVVTHRNSAPCDIWDAKNPMSNLLLSPRGKPCWLIARYKCASRGLLLTEWLMYL